jgi:hypothetical protein
LREHDLLAPPDDEHHKHRLAFSMKHANMLWQADTLFGPSVAVAGGGRKPAKLIAFLDDASRVLCAVPYRALIVFLGSLLPNCDPFGSLG